MSNFSDKTRVSKFDKRRKTTKMMTGLILLGSILLLVLLFFWIFGGNDKKEVANQEDNINIEEHENNQTQNNNDEVDKETNNEEKQEENTGNNASNANDENTEPETENEEVDKEVINSADSNVRQAYTANWSPIGTEQTGAHTTSFEKGSTDWKEMEAAARMATELDNMFTWWIGNDGDQKVVATVSETNGSQAYRVYLSWIENKGWQPTKVEELIENDKGQP